MSQYPQNPDEVARLLNEERLPDPSKMTPDEIYGEIVSYLNRRWPEAEPYILRDVALAFYYAKNILKGRWPEAEPLIMRDAYYACQYAREILRRRWSEAEPAIMRDPSWAYAYAKDVIRNRWPEYERDAEERIDNIATDDLPWLSMYASNVIKGRWPGIEPYIARDAEAGYWYVRNVLGRRWPEYEKYMNRDDNSPNPLDDYEDVTGPNEWWVKYQREFIND